MRTLLLRIGFAGLALGVALIFSHRGDAIQGPFWAIGSGAPANPTPSPPPSGNVVVGGYMDMNCTAASAFEGWLGITAGSSIQIQYNLGPAPTNMPSLGQMETYLQTLQCGHGNNRLQDVDLDINDSVSNVLAGNYDTYLTNVATAMNLYAPKSILRFDWEFNAGYSCVYIGNTQGNFQSNCGKSYTPSNYISVWQHMAAIVRPIAPTVRLAWVPNGCFTSCNGDGNDPINAYPGDGYVDIIGIDHYDQWESGSGGATDWANYYYASGSTHRALAWLASFAQTHGKPMGLETGIGASNLQNYSFSCTIPTPNTLCLNDTQGSQLWPFFANYVKNAISGGNGYQQFAYLDIWNTNEAHICTVTDGTSTCAGGGAPHTAGGTPPSSHSSDYMIPLTAQAYYTAFKGWQ